MAFFLHWMVAKKKTLWRYDDAVCVAATLTLAAKSGLQMDAMMGAVRSAAIPFSLESAFCMDYSDGDTKCLCGHGWNSPNAF